MIDRLSETIDPVEITVLSGFLGSGKTTLIRTLLERPDLERNDMEKQGIAAFDYLEPVIVF